jgi:hypothetical protein
MYGEPGGLSIAKPGGTDSAAAEGGPAIRPRKAASLRYFHPDREDCNFVESNRDRGLDSRETVLPDTFRVNANFFGQIRAGIHNTEKSPGLAVHGLWIPAVLAGITTIVSFKDIPGLL